MIKDLLRDYEPYERPVSNESLAVDVRHGLTLQKLDLDVDKETLTSYTWMNMEWNDANLRWNSSDYGGINDIRFPLDRIWIPDIIPYNAFDYNSVDPRNPMTNIAINSTGDCIWNPPIVLKTACEIDDTNDTQSCNIKVRSWTYTGFKINLILQHSEAYTSSFVRNKEWKLMGTTAQHNEFFYECCEEPYLDITYNIILKRQEHTLKNVFS